MIPTTLADRWRPIPAPVEGLGAGGALAAPSPGSGAASWTQALGCHVAVAGVELARVTIHGEHPFQPPERDRDPLRRFRGRMALPVSLWTSGDPGRRAGWTVSSMMVADGPTPEVLGLLDEDSDLAGSLAGAGRLAVSLLGWEHRLLADAFAGLAPAPGGPFRMTDWIDTEWGPVVENAPAWLGARVLGPPERAGWSLLVRAEIERIEVGAGAGNDLLGHLRGRYIRLASD